LGLRFHKPLVHFLLFIDAKLGLEEEVHLRAQLSVPVHFFLKRRLCFTGPGLDLVELLLHFAVLLLLVKVGLLLLVDFVYKVLQLDLHRKHQRFLHCLRVMLLF
jgi:hypothetical protein